MLQILCSSVRVKIYFPYKRFLILHILLYDISEKNSNSFCSVGCRVKNVSATVAKISEKF